MNNPPATEDDCDLSQQSTDRLADIRAKTMSQLLSRWNFKSKPGDGFLIAAALDPRFRSLKFLEKIDGSCSKFDVRNSISFMALQIEAGILMSIRRLLRVLHLLVVSFRVADEFDVATPRKQKQ